MGAGLKFGVGGAAAAVGRIAPIVVAAMVLVMLGQPLVARGEVRELSWEDLTPEGWDPFAGIEELRGRDVQGLADDSAEAQRLMSIYEDAIRSAPVVDELDGQEVELPGFVVPLDFEGSRTFEFLLVPFFGACIHVPPPPPNQIVFVKTATGYPLKSLFETVTVTGVISTRAHQNGVGDAGYTMQATLVEPL